MNEKQAASSTQQEVTPPAIAMTVVRGTPVEGTITWTDGELARFAKIETAEEGLGLAALAPAAVEWIEKNLPICIRPCRITVKGLAGEQHGWRKLPVQPPVSIETVTQEEKPLSWLVKRGRVKATVKGPVDLVYLAGFASQPPAPVIMAVAALCLEWKRHPELRDVSAGASLSFVRQYLEPFDGGAGCL